MSSPRPKPQAKSKAELCAEERAAKKGAKERARDVRRAEKEREKEARRVERERLKRAKDALKAVEKVNFIFSDSMTEYFTNFYDMYQLLLLFFQAKKVAARAKERSVLFFITSYD